MGLSTHQGRLGRETHWVEASLEKTAVAADRRGPGKMGPGHHLQGGIVSFS